MFLKTGKQVCVYVYMYVYMYVCMYVCMYIYIYIYIYIRAQGQFFIKSPPDICLFPFFSNLLVTNW